jgi:hypothetical protein
LGTDDDAIAKEVIKGIPKTKTKNQISFNLLPLVAIIVD